MKVRISADGSIMLDYHTYEFDWLSIIPLNAIIDGKEYIDKSDIVQKDLFPYIYKGINLKTSAASYGRIVEYFKDIFALGYDKIIHFSMSSKLSSMYSTISNISHELFQDRIIVIDTFGFSSVMLSMAYYTHLQLEKGIELIEFEEDLDEIKQKSKLFFIPGGLDALQKGGRIDSSEINLNQNLNILPVINLEDGGLVRSGITRTPLNTYKTIINKYLDLYPISEYDYSVISFVDKKDLLNNIVNHMNDKIGINNYIQGIMSINLSVHCGLGTIGVMVTPKLKDFSLINLYRK